MSLRVVVGLLVAGLGIASAFPDAAQENPVLMPEESAARAKKLLQQAIEALGGAAYLNVRDMTCTGRVGEFDHNGQLTGFGQFLDYKQPPDRDRQENLPQRNIITVYAGDKGWSLDRGGVSDATTADISDFQESVRKGINFILRSRIHEPDMIIRYGGRDVVDLREAEWVELLGADDRSIRIALDQQTHLPIRKVVEVSDPLAPVKLHETEYYSNYHSISGIETPFQVLRERNGAKIFQIFYDKCDVNTGLDPSLFTRASLEDRYAHVGHHYKEKNDAKK